MKVSGPEPGVAEDRRPLEGEGDPLAVKERVQDPNQAWLKAAVPLKAVKERVQDPNQARLKAAVPLKVKATPW